MRRGSIVCAIMRDRRPLPKTSVRSTGHIGTCRYWPEACRRASYVGLMTLDRSPSSVSHAEDLVRRVRASDPQAFDELYERYSPRVFGYLFQRLNGNAEEAEEPTADVV